MAQARIMHTGEHRLCILGALIMHTRGLIMHTRGLIMHIRGLIMHIRGLIMHIREHRLCIPVGSTRKCCHVHIRHWLLHGVVVVIKGDRQATGRVRQS